MLPRDQDESACGKPFVEIFKGEIYMLYISKAPILAGRDELPRDCSPR